MSARGRYLGGALKVVDGDSDGGGSGGDVGRGSRDGREDAPFDKPRSVAPAARRVTRHTLEALQA